MSVLDLLQSQLSGNTMQQISRQLGADPQSTAKAVSGALPLLLGAMANNTSRPQGAQSLLSALDRDHDGSVLDDLAGFLGSNPQSIGNGILGHVLGDRQDTVASHLGQASGLNAGQVTQLLAMLAPLVMGALGRMRNQGGLDAGALSGLLGREQQRAQQAAPEGLGGMLSHLLDANGDGSVVDDVARMGAGLLGNLLGGGRR